jgi:hypothetical protein
MGYYKDDLASVQDNRNGNYDYEGSYELTGNILVTDDGHTLHQIRCVEPYEKFGVKTGDLGGWIEGTHNLRDGAWAEEHSRIYGKAQASEHAHITGQSILKDDAKAYGSASLKDVQMSDCAQAHSALLVRVTLAGYAEAGENIVVKDKNFFVSEADYLVSCRDLQERKGDDYRMYDLSDISREYNGEKLFRVRCVEPIPRYGITPGELGGWVSGTQNLTDRAWVGNDGIIAGNAVAAGEALVEKNAVLDSYAKINGKVVMTDNAMARGWSAITDDAVMRDNAVSMGHSVIGGKSVIDGNQIIENKTIKDGVELHGQEAEQFAWKIIGHEARDVGGKKGVMERLADAKTKAQDGGAPEPKKRDGPEL